MSTKRVSDRWTPHHGWRVPFSTRTRPSRGRPGGGRAAGAGDLTSGGRPTAGGGPVADLPPAGTDVWADPDAVEVLGDRIALLTAHIAAATHELLVMIAEFDRLRGWEAGGHRSCAHWLAFRTQVDLGTAREKVRAARALETLPETAAAMSRGELTFSQVRALTRIADASNERELLELARGLTIQKLERVVRAWRCSSTRRDEAERERERLESRTLSIFPDDDGMYLVRGRLMPEAAALLMRAIDAASDQLFRERRPGASEDSVRAAAQRRADAVSLVAERALASGSVGDDAAKAGDDVVVPISGTRAARYQVVVHVDADALVAEDGAVSGSVAHPGISCETSGRRSAHGSSGGGELEDGTRLSQEAARRLCCDASVVRVLRDRSGGVLDVGRRTRTIPPSLRRALEVRDGGCRFPGCGLRFTDAHHVRHWADAGETSLANCLLLCAHHHRLVHEGGWRVEWWGRSIAVFTDPRGNTHSDARVHETPPLPADPAGALAAAQRRRGGAPVASGPGTPGVSGLGARWRTEREIPHEVWRRASEAL